MTATDRTEPSGRRRLHPWSWLFVLLSRLRPFLLPAILLLFFGQGSSWEMWGAVGAAVVALYALIYSFGFNYELVDGELVIREGVIFRTERHIPFARVQSIVQRRNALHLVFGVTELRLESAGGARPEAAMTVISVAEAQRLERVIRDTAMVAPAASPEEASDRSEAPSPAPDVAHTLFALPTAEVLRLGLISNRGWIVVGVAIGLYWQLAPSDHGLSKMIGLLFMQVASLWGRDPQDALLTLALVIPGLLAFGLLLKPLSMVMTWLMFHGFRLRRSNGRLSSASGLLTRRSASARSERIQRLVARESLLARMLGRRTLSCDVAVNRESEGDEMSRMHWLAPIATPLGLNALVRELAPCMGIEPREWRPLHPGAWKRVFKHYVLVALVVAVALFWPLRHLAVVPLLAIVVYGWFAARGWAKFAAWSLDGDSLAFRAGWIVREWTTALVGNGHVVSLHESPFDRQRGMASIGLDTAGASTSLLPLRVPYLPVATAREIHRSLIERVAAKDD